MKRTMNALRRFGAIAAAAAAAGLLLTSGPASAQSQGKVKIGLMLPYTGTFAALGNAITNAFKLAIDEQGGKLGGREIEYFTVDDESDPAKAPENANKLIKRDQVDVLVGTVHSGVRARHGESRTRQQHAARHPERRRRRHYRSAVRGQRVPHVVLELADGHRDGQGDGRAEEEDGGHDHLEVRGGRRESIGGFKEAFEAGGGKVDQGTVRCRSRRSSSRRC